MSPLTITETKPKATITPQEQKQKVGTNGHKKRILSGIQPSGTLHIGNYFGMMQRMIELQETSELYCFIVNLHALTSVTDGELLRQRTIEACMDFLALGLDPNKTIFYVQGDVPEVVELTWYLMNVTPFSLLQLGHSYKDKVAKGIAPNAGLFTYPVLMAADILLYQANGVPVGKDQKQHLEMTRDIAQKFNALHNDDIFAIPEPLIAENVAIVPGIDGQKMSKSYDNTIEIFSSGKPLKKRCMGIVTDSAEIEDVKDPETSVMFQLYKLFATPDEIKELEDRYRTPGLKYSEVKKLLAKTIEEYFAPFREKREDLAKHPDHVIEIMKSGAEKARAKAMPTLEKVRSVSGMRYHVGGK